LRCTVTDPSDSEASGLELLGGTDDGNAMSGLRGGELAPVRVGLGGAQEVLVAVDGLAEYVGRRISVWFR
jgi:hypothetical protein